MALAAHFTQVKCGTTTTLETVRFQRPDRIDFRLVRGPVPHLVESFLLTSSDTGTSLLWQASLALTSGPSANGGVEESRTPGRTRCRSHFVRSPSKPNAGHRVTD
jgi:hypothetical protein